MPKDSLKDKLEGNELDLSLSDISVIPVKELAQLPKATHLDLSCNNIIEVPDAFCFLQHITVLDLSKNQIRSLPPQFGELSMLQKLDLYKNKLMILPVSFCHLNKLRWLDLKDNPLTETLAKIAGDCLDDEQCRKCAKQVVEYFRQVQSAQEREKQRQLKIQREMEAQRKIEEEKEREQVKQAKKLEKERRRKEYQEAQIEKRKREAALAAEREEEQKSSMSENGQIQKNQVNKETYQSGDWRFYIWFASFIVAISAIIGGFYFYCMQAYVAPSSDYCVTFTTTWAAIYQKAEETIPAAGNKIMDAFQAVSLIVIQSWNVLIEGILLCISRIQDIINDLLK